VRGQDVRGWDVHGQSAGSMPGTAGVRFVRFAVTSAVQWTCVEASGFLSAP